MKKLLFLALLCFSIISCDINGDSNPPNFVTEFMPIQSVDVPDEFMVGETYTITARYFRPDDCYEFSDFFISTSINETTVAVINNVFLDGPCNTLNDLEEESFDFIVLSNQTYVFNFWQGVDESGEDVYLTINVPVVE
ncbi:hypothetical protein RM697_05610 [Ichthyenterobacterium sp. W332]|uniref:Lipoprotein n=1 Tax=Microcosmobacter mediterraneus TaxID=3075607 RepID=A0ABU2YIV8_9FLAO|nr:hypothetical protein [Ichthyenterobacterium sp. W332]MDT0558111.1 hypothetical protein [Ichthyenterobacterium sp. W332]